jgi:AraC-like DNA-binding protein
VSLKDREAAQASPNELIVASLCHPTRFLMPACSLRTVQIRRSIIAPLVSAIDDPPVRTVSLARPEAHLLFSYVDAISHLDLSTPELRQTVANHMRDLAALVVGATRDAGELARLGGVRAARIQQILTEIKAGFASPAFSALTVARKLALSPRYVQDLLHDTGSSFSERVMELRLQKARVMLEDRDSLGLRISAIALACGFGDISYFNQCFRRRFGASPTQFRGP